MPQYYQRLPPIQICASCPLQTPKKNCPLRPPRTTKKTNSFVRLRALRGQKFLTWWTTPPNCSLSASTDSPPPDQWRYLHRPSSPHAAPSYDPSLQNARQFPRGNTSCISSPATCKPAEE